MHYRSKDGRATRSTELRYYHRESRINPYFVTGLLKSEPEWSVPVTNGLMTHGNGMQLSRVENMAKGSVSYLKREVFEGAEEELITDQFEINEQGRIIGILSGKPDIDFSFWLQMEYGAPYDLEDSSTYRCPENHAGRWTKDLLVRLERLGVSGKRQVRFMEGVPVPFRLPYKKPGLTGTIQMHEGARQQVLVNIQSHNTQRMSFPLAFEFESNVAHVGGGLSRFYSSLDSQPWNRLRAVDVVVFRVEDAQLRKLLLDANGRFYPGRGYLDLPRKYMWTREE